MDTTAPAPEGTDLVGLTVELLAAYVTNNTVPFDELPRLFASVHAAMTQLGQPQAPAALTYEPAVPVKKSVTPDALISLIDGKPYRTLKRHLTTHGLTPAEYRSRYGLPHDYPMVSQSYAAMRSQMAKSIGLGARGRGATVASPSAAVAVPAEKPSSKRGGSRRKALAKPGPSASAATVVEQAAPKRRGRRAKA